MLSDQLSFTQITFRERKGMGEPSSSCCPPWAENTATLGEAWREGLRSWTVPTLGCGPEVPRVLIQGLGLLLEVKRKVSGRVTTAQVCNSFSKNAF